MAWQDELKKNIHGMDELLRYFPMPREEREQMEGVLKRFPLSVTRYYLSLIDFSDPRDPIRKMAIPSREEAAMGGSFDTSGEAHNTVAPGLQHKYRETAMLLSTNRCAMYCRHCFRKRMVGYSYAEVAEHFGGMRDYILAHTEIRNALISGGDALLNENETLELILSALEDIPHLDALRLGSRVPVVFPKRVSQDAALLNLLAKHNRRKQLYVVTQYNHPRELTDESADAVRAIQSIGIPVENQAVLLRGVNDDPRVMGDLLRGLTRVGVIPYYVFQCRPVKGVKGRFQVPILEGIRIVEGAKATQNGLGKSFRYCMSHSTGKLEILGGRKEDGVLFQYHEARDPGLLGRTFRKKVDGAQAWLEEDVLPADG